MAGAEKTQTMMPIRQALMNPAGVTPVHRGFLSNMKAEELPFENLDEFSTSPLDFEQTALLLWNDTQIIYQHACIENRFSENYLKYCNQLEKNIKRVGSLCLSKAVLEQNGQQFPQLSSMTIPELSGMVSFHLQKCHAALEGLYWDNNYLGMSYLSWEFRWFDLAKRLNATEAKIKKIHAGEITYEAGFSGSACPDKTMTEPDSEQTKADKSGVSPLKATSVVCNPASLRINANALPLDGSMAGHLVRAAKKQAREEEKAQRAMERKRSQAEHQYNAGYLDLFQPLDEFEAFPLLKEFMKDGDETPSAATDRYIDYCEEPEVRESISAENPPEPKAEQKKTESSPAEKSPEPKAEQKKSGCKVNKELPPGEISEAEARQILIKDAMERRDQEALIAIPLENTREVHERWERYREKMGKAARSPLSPGRAGPSAETRKKLRAKRKKR